MSGLPNPPLQLTAGSVAALPLAAAAERQGRWADWECQGTWTMKRSSTRILSAAIAGAATLLTCVLAAQTRATAIGIPLPWQYYPDTGRTPIDHGTVLADIIFWLVLYYGLVRGFL